MAFICSLDEPFVELTKSLKLGFMKANSKRQCRAREALRGQFQMHVCRANLFETILNDPKRQVRPVTVPAQVAKIQMPQLGGHDFRRRVRGSFVGKMTMAA